MSVLFLFPLNKWVPAARYVIGNEDKNTIFSAWPENCPHQILPWVRDRVWVRTGGNLPEEFSANLFFRKRPKKIKKSKNGRKYTKNREFFFTILGKGTLMGATIACIEMERPTICHSWLSIEWWTMFIKTFLPLHCNNLKVDSRVRWSDSL